MILDLTEQVSRLRALQPNWDSYGGKPPCEEALGVAEALAMVLASPVQLVACSSGAIQLEWHCRGWNIEIFVPPGGVYDYEVFIERTQAERNV